jgi:hypothetical protein
VIDTKLNPGVFLSEQKGRRVPDDQWFVLRDRGELEPGDYGLVTGGEPRRWLLARYGGPKSDHWVVTDPGDDWFPGDDWEIFEVEERSTTGWHARCPNGVDVNLSPCHPVTVQEDGTVSVSGSILAGDWHGWLCRGVWRLK